MSVKINGHTIASKLRKMFSSNGQTVASNLDGEIPSGGGSDGSGGALIVTMTQDHPGGLRWESENTYGEVYEAMLAGRPVFIKCEGEPINNGGGTWGLESIYQVIFAGKDTYGSVTIRIPEFLTASYDGIKSIDLSGSYDSTIYVTYYD